MFFVGINTKQSKDIKYGPFIDLNESVAFCEYKLGNFIYNNHSLVVGYWDLFPQYAYTYEEAKRYIVNNKLERGT